MSKVTDDLRKANESTVSYIERLEAQLNRTNAYFKAYAMDHGTLPVGDEMPGYTSTAQGIFDENDKLLGEQ